MSIFSHRDRISCQTGGPECHGLKIKFAKYRVDLGKFDGSDMDPFAGILFFTIRRTMTKKQLLREIVDNLNLSSVAYREYLQQGRTFEKACLLRKYNDRMHELLSENASLLGEDHLNDAQALLAHYESWREKWDALKEKIHPGPSDEFVFPNSDTFPRQAANNLEKEYLEMGKGG
jgi:hypothetical protein